MKTGSLTPEAQEKLNAFRAQIDALDKQLIALLKERIEIVSEVGRLKRGDDTLQCFIRSGREADMLRDIYAEFKDSKFHPEAACAIWREIISASTQHESNMCLLTPKALTAPAQHYFGEFMPLTETLDAKDAIARLQEQPSALIIMPLWQDDPLYWQEFAAHKPDSLKVFAAIPFLSKAPQAFVAANLTPEASRDDISLFMDESGQIEEIDGYHTESPLASGEAKGHKRWLGTYARPIK